MQGGDRRRSCPDASGWGEADGGCGSLDKSQEAVGAEATATPRNDDGAAKWTRSQVSRAGSLPRMALWSCGGAGAVDEAAGPLPRTRPQCSPGGIPVHAAAGRPRRLRMIGDGVESRHRGHGEQDEAAGHGQGFSGGKGSADAH